METAIITTFSRWNEPPRIRHQLARQLARFYRVIFIEFPTDWKRLNLTKIDNVEHNITRCRLSTLFPIPTRLQFYIPSFFNFAQWLNLKKVSILLNKLAISNPILFNFNYNAVQIMRSDLFSLKVYICNDDIVAGVFGKVARRLRSERQLNTAKSADLCLAVSYPLVDLLKRVNPNTKLLLPGNELTFGTQKYPLRSRKLPIKVCFMGYINKRLDFEWIEHVSSQTDIEFHLVGPLNINKEASQSSLNNSRIKLHKPIYGDALSNLLESMDVLVMPYDITIKSVLATTAPNKFFQYLAAGKPIVISNLPHFIRLDEGMIYRAYSKESFLKKIRLAFFEDCEEYRKNRIQIAAKNSWDQRGNSLKTLINKQLEINQNPEAN